MTFLTIVRFASKFKALSVFTTRELGVSALNSLILDGGNGKIKRNIDADLVLRAALELSDYDKAVIVSSDGDFYSLVQYLHDNNKLKVVLSPDIKNCSNLLKQTAKEKIWFMNELRDKLEYKKKSTA